MISLRKKTISILIICIALFSSVNLFAQTGRKPSGNYSKEKTNVKTSERYLSEITTFDDFNRLARVYNEKTVHEIPHILFLIDRGKENSMYYINTPKYEFHLYFINELLNRNYVSSDMKTYYTDINRRFILGTLSFQGHIKKYTYEFWEGDKITHELLEITHEVIGQSFFEPLTFKTNSTLHEEVARQLGIDFVTQDQIVKEYPYIAFNTGKSEGRLRIAESIEELADLNEYDLIVLKEVPIAIPAVAGVITEKASTLLSHVNVLARGLKIPSVYLKNAAAELEPYNGKFVEFKATQNGYTIKEISDPKKIKSKSVRYSIKSDIRKTDLILLKEMRAKDHIYCGAKAANLGEIKLKIKNLIIPDGFSIPFSHYHTFMKENGLYEYINEIKNLPGFFEQAEVRKTELKKLQSKIEETDVDYSTAKEWIDEWRIELGGKGVFVRSSSNAEDLKNFSGAGLFTTVPNVIGDEDLIKAIKKVWASVYNFEAYESFRTAGIPDSLIMMSVFVQQAVDSEISGVMVTMDPYNPIRPDITYIAAKRGIGVKVVEGKRIAEQVMYSKRTKSIQLISRSEEDTELRLDSSGGIKEIPLEPDARVMSDELVENLASSGRKIKQLFKTDMDIEWAVSGGQIIILQARPYK